MSAGAGEPPDDETKTSIYDARRESPAAPVAPSSPMRAVSKKTAPGLESDKFARPLPEVKLRSISEVRDRTPPPRALGNLAPPRDAKQARSRRVTDYVVWGSAAVIVASIVMLLVWFLAR